MKLELVQNFRLEQQLKMSPQLIQRIEILQLASMDLKELIQQELMENETLELGENATDTKQDEKTEKTTEDENEISEEDYSLDENLERLTSLSEWNSDLMPSRSSYSKGDRDPKMEAMQNTACKPLSMHDHLKNQLQLTDCDPFLKKIAQEIIYNINDRGYLLYPLEEIMIPMSDEVSIEMMEEALAIIQSFDPLGVGSRNLQECLLMQLTDRFPLQKLMRKIILDHIEDVSKNRLPKIVKATHESIETIQAAISSIARLDPIPGREFGVDAAPRILPDVVIELVEGKYEIRLENDYYPKLGLSSAYLRMYRDKRVDPKLRKHIREKIESAKWLIESIEQRKSTLTRVVHELVDHQKDFIDRGVKYLKPLKMQEIADKLSIHVSTVSRAISEKYVQTHRGIFPLKSFFTGGAKSSNGSIESRAGVKEKVKEIIDLEDKENPLSDQDIVDKLKNECFDIARRTDRNKVQKGFEYTLIQIEKGVW